MISGLPDGGFVTAGFFLQVVKHCFGYDLYCTANSAPATHDVSDDLSGRMKLPLPVADDGKPTTAAIAA